MMDKDWIKANRMSKEYEKGVENFIEFAKNNCVDPNNMSCPCANCYNLKNHTIEEIEDHLYVNGIDQTYTRWIWHGEVDELVDNEDNELDMIHDVDEQFIDHPEQFESLLNDAKSPLYVGCKFSKLSSLVRLWNLKAGGGWTNHSFTLLLEFIKELLPDENKITTSIYETKKILCSLGMEYKKIHACPNDCILYRKENAELESCPRCNESRWKLGRNPSNGNKGVPAKVLWYIPPIPRFQRLFRNATHSKNLTWHADRVVSDNKLRHPADSPQWKTFDALNSEFSSEARNLRLGLSADGINPHSNFSSRHSCWSVILVIYNLPPWLCMKRRFLLLTLLISGPKQPGNDIDVYLSPLVDDLKTLWETGVQVRDGYRGDTFTLRAMLLWTINDFPAYGNLSGWPVKGYKGCPICGENTFSIHLKNKMQIVYLGHRRFLHRHHPYRSQKKPFNGQTEHGTPPRPLSGEQVFQRIKDLNFTFGKGKATGDDGNDDNIRHGQGLWKKRSIFFELPYWKTLLVRHNLDVMHIEKNVCDVIVGTLLNIPGKTKDGLKTRLDLVELNIREELRPQKKNGRTLLPPARYTLSRKEKRAFCQCLANIKVPDGYSSNIRNLVSPNDLKLVGLKSHDCHVLMQQLLPVALRAVLQKEKEVKYAIVKLCFFFSSICSKVLDPTKLDELQVDLVNTLCILEKCFPPSFFTIMVHLMVHLIREAKLCGPVYLRWMYPFERYMKILKGYVKNRNRPEGCIVESYIAEEAVEFCTEYLVGVESIGIPKEKRSSDSDGIGTSAGIPYLTDYESLQKAHLHVLYNSAEIDPYIKVHMNHLKEKYPRKSKSEKWLQDEHNKTFIDWLKDHIYEKLEETNNGVSEDVILLANGPSQTVTRYSAYAINGYCFYTRQRDEKHPVQNSGVSIEAEAMHIASAKDKNPIYGKMHYYGVIEDIWEVVYCSLRVPLFRCKWVDNTSVWMDKDGLIVVNFEREGYKNEPFILATQAKQVFYIADPERSENSKVAIVLPMKSRIIEEVNEFDDQYEGVHSFSECFPSAEEVDGLDEHMYNEENLIRQEGEWICIQKGKKKS